MPPLPEVPRIAAFGSCYVDKIAYDFPIHKGQRPVELVSKGKYELRAGGSAVNFCRIVGALGLQTVFTGMVGNDLYGEMLLKLLRQADIEPQLIVNPHVQTNYSMNKTSSEGDHEMDVVGTANAALSPEAVLPRLEEIFPAIDLLYLGGCYKLLAFQDAFAEIADMAARHMRGFAVDHGRLPEDTAPSMIQAIRTLVQKADFYFPSKDEFIETWDLHGDTAQSAISSGLQQLHDDTQHLTVVVKDGSQGAYYWEDNRLQHVPTKEVANPKDLTGAGDSFNAGVIAAATGGYALRQAIEAGHRVATAHITGQPIDPSLIQSA